MSTKEKISPSFHACFAQCGAHDKREAIVIFRRPGEATTPLRGRLRVLKERRATVARQAAAQCELQNPVLESYQSLGTKMLPGSARVETTSIGRSALPVARVEVTRRTLSLLAEQDDVLAVIPNQKLRLIEPKEVDLGRLERQELRDGLTWGLKKLGIPKLWERSRGRGVRVAVLDTGVHGEHEALAGRVKEFIVIDPLGRRIRARPSFDSAAHGTHVCGTIAGATENMAMGVAPEAELCVAGVLLGESTLASVLEGIDWAVEQNVDIINMSLGFTYYEPQFSELLASLIESFGILPVVAVGNENHGNTSSPGNIESALSVGAVEKMPRGKVDVASFSGGASLVFPGSDEAELITKPDVVAPGVQIYSCTPPERAEDGSLFEYSYMAGSSMAAPHVSGVAALLMAAVPKAPVTDILQALRETAKHPRGRKQRPDNRWGYGLIRPKQALKSLLS